MEIQGNSWGIIVLSLCGGVIVAVTALATSTQTELLNTVSVRSKNVAATTARGYFQQQPTARNVERASVIMMKAEEPAFSSATSTPSSPATIGIVAAMSTIVGAVAMKVWGQRVQSSPELVDLQGSASPMEFRAAAPWSSGASLLNGPDFSQASRGSRLVLQAAKGKGKGGGAKGRIAGIIKLALPAGKATPAPPVGPALGQYGLNIVAFCKEYNAATEKEAAENMIIPVEITAFEDRSYSFVLKTPPASVLLKKFAGVPSGSATPNKLKVGKVTRAQLEEIAKIKLPDLNTSDVGQAMKIVEGTAKQMGITIEA